MYIFKNKQLINLNRKRTHKQIKISSSSFKSVDFFSYFIIFRWQIFGYLIGNDDIFFVFFFYFYKQIIISIFISYFYYLYICYFILLNTKITIPQFYFIFFFVANCQTKLNFKSSYNMFWKISLSLSLSFKLKFSSSLYLLFKIHLKFYFHKTIKYIFIAVHNNIILNYFSFKINI